MKELHQQTCQACTSDASPVTPGELETFKAQIPDWEVINEDGTLRLKKPYTFPDFRQALTFTNQIGELAEQEGHHPALLTEWGKVTVLWWTHAINGLHKNDFIMAAKTDKIRENLR